mmetsp:Transcript_2348/g.2210  ORF Transcript_2348/g.2210 Transcript_2348/m.2210 type:complete len:178 (+) Transcript_2348:111-644(+)
MLMRTKKYSLSLRPQDQQGNPNLIPFINKIESQFTIKEIDKDGNEVLRNQGKMIFLDRNNLKRRVNQFVGFSDLEWYTAAKPSTIHSVVCESVCNDDYQDGYLRCINHDEYMNTQSKESCFSMNIHLEYGCNCAAIMPVNKTSTELLVDEVASQIEQEGRVLVIAGLDNGSIVLSHC